MTVGESLNICVHRDVLLVLNLYHSLYSAGSMCTNRIQVLFLEKKVAINDRDRSVAAGYKRGSLYVLHMAMPKRTLHSSLETWQACVGHLSPKRVLQMPLTNVSEIL